MRDSDSDSQNRTAKRTREQTLKKMAKTSAFLVALVQKVRDAKSVDEQQSAFQMLGECSQYWYGFEEELIAAGMLPVAVKLFMECDDDDLRGTCAQQMYNMATVEGMPEKIATSYQGLLEALVNFTSYVDEDGYCVAADVLEYIMQDNRTIRQWVRDVPNVCDTLRKVRKKDNDAVIGQLLDYLLPLSVSGKRINPARA